MTGVREEEAGEEGEARVKRVETPLERVERIVC